MENQAIEWLAAAATDPQRCRQEWEQGAETVLLQAGRLWDVLSVPEDLGLCALDLLGRDRRGAPAPTLVDCAARRVGFFLPPSPTAIEWAGSGVRRAGRGSWIAVPRPDGAARRLEWLVPPDGTGTLHEPRLVELALREAGGTVPSLTRRHDMADVAVRAGHGADVLGIPNDGDHTTDSGGGDAGCPWCAALRTASKRSTTQPPAHDPYVSGVRQGSGDGQTDNGPWHLPSRVRGVSRLWSRRRPRRA
ncbi:hypothetical protein [Streptomyces sp. TRM68367]|uniref:hypothetical protein n=1 Tax=Streptomyces sp. TRM68367 TaxID=2758415 RepID=UPI0029347DFE|nr:hypothetical protein [Streptomyces sp. TRM68367]